MMPTTPVNSRLPYSIHWLSVSYSGCSTGTMLPGKHCGHVGQPSPEPVTRTIAPVIAMSAWVASTAIAKPELHATTRVGQAVDTGLQRCARHRAIVRTTR